MFKKGTNKSKTYRQADDTLSKSRNTLLKSPKAKSTKRSTATAYNKTLTNITLGAFSRTPVDNTIDSLRRPVGSLNCRRSSDHGISGTTRAILLTGGLEVTKEGFVSVKEAKFATQYKKRYVIFEQGMVKIFDPLILKNVRMRNFADPSDFDKLAEQLLPITELKNIAYEKRKGKVFALTFRSADPDTNSNSNSGKNESKRKTVGSNKSKSLTSPVNFSNLAANFLPRRTEFTFYFKTSSGTDSDDWVQSILYEIRNQASFVDRTIHMLQRRQTKTHRNTATSTENIDNINAVENDIEEKLDVLFRQSVDLWAIAKGKVSKESLESLTKFVAFLKEIESDEVEYWSQAVELISTVFTENEAEENMNIPNNKLLSGSFSGSFSFAEDLSNLTGLEQLQKLNEEEFHLSSEKMGTFRSTILNTLVKKAKKTTNTSNTELSPEIRRKRLTKRTFSDEQKLVLENNIKSALDMKEEREFEEDKQALQRLSTKRLDIINQETEKAVNEERKESKDSGITKML